MIIVKITGFIGILLIVIYFFIRRIYDNNAQLRLNLKIKKCIWDSETCFFAILGCLTLSEGILIIISIFYLIFLR